MVGHECYVANVGDSRAIMSADDGKKLFLLSRDHRPDEIHEEKRIVENGGSVYRTPNIQMVPDNTPGSAEGKMKEQVCYGPHRV